MVKAKVRQSKVVQVAQRREARRAQYHLKLAQPVLKRNTAVGRLFAANVKAHTELRKDIDRVDQLCA